jgi:hypothetical protein
MPLDSTNSLTNRGVGSQLCGMSGALLARDIENPPLIRVVVEPHAHTSCSWILRRSMPPGAREHMGLEPRIVVGGAEA